VASGEILWSDRIDAQGDDILALQDMIGLRILDGLRMELSETEQEKLGRRPTDNAEAWEEYLRGRDNFGRFIFRTVSNEDAEAAIANFKHAIDLDPQFALAYSGLGACYANRFLKGLGEPEDYTMAESAFTKAFFYDPDVTEARVLTVMIYMARGEKKKAHAEIKILQEQFPNEAPLYFVKGIMHRLDGEYEESLKAFQKLARLDPAARVVAAYNRARIFIYQRRFDEAMKEIEKGKKAEPNHPMLRIFHAGLLFHRGEREEGVKMLQKVIADNPQMDGIRPLLAAFLAAVGRNDEARAELTEDAMALAKSDHDMAYWAGEAYAQLGEKDSAFKWLNRAIKLGNENKAFYENDVLLEPLRDDPRYNELIEQMGKKD
jgi:Flp pilus assembly protein TadD